MMSECLVLDVLAHISPDRGLVHCDWGIGRREGVEGLLKESCHLGQGLDIAVTSLTGEPVEVDDWGFAGIGAPQGDGAGGTLSRRVDLDHRHGPAFSRWRSI